MADIVIVYGQNDP